LVIGVLLSCATTQGPIKNSEEAKETKKNATSAAWVDSLVTSFASGDYKAVHASFDPKMAKAVTVKMLELGWIKKTKGLGPFVGHELIHHVEEEGLTTVLARLRFEHGTRAIKVARAQNGLVVGIRVDTEVRLMPARRPQTPKGPFPYTRQDVRFKNAQDGTELAGTLTLPKGISRAPVVVLLSGSGPQDRDSTVAKHKPFWVIADHLSRNGIGVLRVDDRGVGQSGGADRAPNFSDFEGDAKAAVAFLRKTEGVDPAKVGLLGHSQGGMIAPWVAANDPKIAFVVMLAGPGVDGIEVLMRQYLDILRVSGVKEETLKQIEPMHRKTLELAMNGAPKIEVRAQLIQEIRLATSFLPAHGTPEQIEAYIQGSADQAIGALLLPWYRDFANFKTSTWLKKLQCPVLALVGEKDIQVAADPNLAATEAALKAGGNKNYKVKKIPGLNHLFQTAKTGNMSEYETIQETFHPQTLDLISTWLIAVTQQK